MNVKELRNKTGLNQELTTPFSKLKLISLRKRMFKVYSLTHKALSTGGMHPMYKTPEQGQAIIKEMANEFVNAMGIELPLINNVLN